MQKFDYSIFFNEYGEYDTWDCEIDFLDIFIPDCAANNNWPVNIYKFWSAICKKLNFEQFQDGPLEGYDIEDMYLEYVDIIEQKYPTVYSKLEILTDDQLDSDDDAYWWNEDNWPHGNDEWFETDLLK